MKIKNNKTKYRYFFHPTDDGIFDKLFRKSGGKRGKVEYLYLTSTDREWAPAGFFQKERFKLATEISETEAFLKLL